jgi:hypothetical protein
VPHGGRFCPLLDVGRLDGFRLVSDFYGDPTANPL